MLSMIENIAIIIFGVAMVLYGADILTTGASALARRMKVPEIIIGLTIVAVGTSAPELFVSLASAIEGTPDMAVGNVVGSNTMNSMLIVGVAAMVAPIAVSKATVKKDIPFSVLSSLLLIAIAYDGSLSRWDALILLLVFAAFMTYTLRVAKHQPTEAQEVKPQSVYKSIAEVIGGLSFLLIGSNIFVHEASDLALTLGLSEGVVGLTVVAGGTSLPELATTVVAARKGQSALAIGNVIGSNVFNILLILGLTATIQPLQIEGITTLDMTVMLLSVSLVWLFSFTRFTVERWEGALLVGGYLVYLVWLISSL